MEKSLTSSSRLNKLIEKCIHEPILKLYISAGSKPGDNHIGKMVSVRATTESGKEADVIVKTLVPFAADGEPISESDKKFAKSLTMFHIFTTELSYYQRIKPELDNLYPGYSLPVPSYYFGEDDVANDGLEACLVLEDMRPKGFNMSDKMIGFTREEVFLILEKVAKFHAASALYLQKSNTLAADQPFNILTKHIFQKPTGGAVENVYRKFLTEVYVDMIRTTEESGIISPTLAKKILEYAPNSGNLILQDFENSRQEYFPVVIHGDLWTNNVLFKYDAGGKPVDVLFVDFQQCRYASVFDELHFLFYTSTTDKFRQEHLQACLDFYYQSFIETINKLVIQHAVDMDGQKFLNKFSKQAFLSGYHKYLGSAFCYGIFAIPFIVGIPPSDATPVNMEGCSTYSDRNGTQLSEEQGLELFITDMYESLIGRLKAAGKNSPTALERCREMCLEMDALGIFDKQMASKKHGCQL